MMLIILICRMWSLSTIKGRWEEVKEETNIVSAGVTLQYICISWTFFYLQYFISNIYFISIYYILVGWSRLTIYLNFMNLFYLQYFIFDIYFIFLYYIWAGWSNLTMYLHFMNLLSSQGSLLISKLEFFIKADFRGLGFLSVGPMQFLI